jgi:hypothetical protein
LLSVALDTFDLQNVQGELIVTSDEPTAAEAEALAELERQEREERLAQIRAQEEARQQDLAREHSEKLTVIADQFAAATRDDAALTRQRRRVADAIVDYLRQEEERRRKLTDVLQALQALPFEVGGELQYELGSRTSGTLSEHVLLWRVARQLRQPPDTRDATLMPPPRPASLAEPELPTERMKRSLMLQERSAMARKAS